MAIPKKNNTKPVKKVNAKKNINGTTKTPIKTPRESKRAPND